MLFSLILSFFGLLFRISLHKQRLKWGDFFTQIITSGISNGDVAVFRRVIALMSHLLANFDDLQFPSYAEWVGCKVRIVHR